MLENKQIKKMVDVVFKKEKPKRKKKQEEIFERATPTYTRQMKRRKKRKILKS